MSKPQKILITGGAGYLGSVMIPRLLRNGYAVRVLDNFMFKQTSLLPHFIHPNFECIQGDVRHRETVQEALDGVDFVLHLAALVGAPICSQFEKDAWETNYEAAMLLEELRAPGTKYLYPNSTSGYGTQVPVAGLCTEDTPQEPISVYGKSKVKAEQELLTKEDVVTFRFTTVFGLAPRLRLDLMPNDFMWRAIHHKALLVFEGDFKRSFLHVTDVARFVQFTMEHFDEMKGRCFNVGHERMNKTKRELAEKIAEFTDCYLHFTELREDPDKRNYFISFERLQSVGFEPKVGWDDGLLSLYKGLKTLHWSIPHANVEYY